MKFAAILCAIAGVLIPIHSASATYLQFSNPTDTISVAGNTVLPNQNQVTYEAIIDPTSTAYAPSSSSNPSGEIYNAWDYGLEDEHFWIDSTKTLGAYAFPINWPNSLTGGTVPLNNWLDVAYVYDGTQERLYIDGTLVASRPAQITLTGGPWPTNGDLSYNASGIVSIGAMNRDGGIDPAFIGDIQSLRISNAARYSGNSYSPSTTDFANDSSTILLYDFDQLSLGDTTIPDLSGNNHTGTFGVGFIGATSPTIVVPEPTSIGVIALGLLLYRRHSRSGY